MEAATGGEDVVRFCGGLEAVLGAAGVSLQKALPCPHTGTTCSQHNVVSQSNNQQSHDGANHQGSAALVPGAEQNCCESVQQGAEPSEDSILIGTAQPEAQIDGQLSPSNQPKHQVLHMAMTLAP